MMQRYLKDEELKGENQYHCEKCNKKSELTIKTSKWKRLPPILIVMANRFSDKTRKIIHKITNIPQEFSIQDIFKKDHFENLPSEEIKDLDGEEIKSFLDYNYTLYCIIIHKGLTLEQGHYFIYAKDLTDNKWFVLDDKNMEVEETSFEREAFDETPYTFYYIEKNSLTRTDS